MKNLALVSLAVLSISACSPMTDKVVLSNRAGLIFDSVSTTAALSSGFVELNPVLSGSCGGSPIGVGVYAFGGKVIMEKNVDRSLQRRADYYLGMARKYSNAVGFLGGCNNVAILAGAAAPAALFLGAACAMPYLQLRNEHEATEKQATLEPEIGDSCAVNDRILSENASKQRCKCTFQISSGRKNNKTNTSHYMRHGRTDQTGNWSVHSIREYPSI